MAFKALLSRQQANENPDKQKTEKILKT